MVEEVEKKIEMSPLCRKISRDGTSVEILIYSDGNYGWILEVVDEDDASTVWDNPFLTDQAALSEVMKTIDEKGIYSFLLSPEDQVH
mgnify:CR=1 FL=1